MGSEPVRGQVKRRYAAGALSVHEGGASFCCWLDAGRVLASEEPRVDWAGRSYWEAEKRELPRAAVETSLGCGNSVALAGDAHPGRGGPGPGKRRQDRRPALGTTGVSSGGMAYGLDMTDESLKLARENKPEAGVKNAEFLSRGR